MSRDELAHSLTLDLYAQVVALTAENAELRRQLALVDDSEPTPDR